MENNENKKVPGGIIGAVIVIIVAVVLIVYLLPKGNPAVLQNDISNQAMDTQTETMPAMPETPAPTSSVSDSQSKDTPASIEADLNSFDSSASDINFDGSEI